jgi:hypothetical protein
MKLLFPVLAALIAAACSSAPPPSPAAQLSEIEPGVYLLMKGTEKQMRDIPAMSKAMLVAGDHCAKQNQGPELIIGKDGDLSYLAFKCAPGEIWPARR